MRNFGDSGTVGAVRESFPSLDALCAALRQAAGDNLVAVVLYGGVARGRYRPGASDVNVAVVLRDASGPALAAIGPALHDAWRAQRVEPFILAEEEIPRAAVAFPTKLLDIERHHVVLAGRDPFAGLSVPRAQVRLRVEQELRNLLLRMRHRLVLVGDERHEIAAIAAHAAAPLAVNLRALLHLHDVVAFEAQPALPIFDRAAAAFGLDSEALAAVKRAHESDDGGGELAPQVLHRVLAAVARAADVAAQPEPQGEVPRGSA